MEKLFTITNCNIGTAGTSAIGPLAGRASSPMFIAPSDFFFRELFNVHAGREAGKAPRNEFSKSRFGKMLPRSIKTGLPDIVETDMSKTIALALRADDAEPILRHAAKEAAEFGALLDYATRKTGGIRHRGMGERYEDARKRWHQRFTKAKRMVEAFGVEYEPTSEGEALTVDYRYVGGKTKVLSDIPGIGPIACTTGSKPDYDNPYPAFRGEIHTEACRQAADRVVRRWRQSLELAKAA